MLSLMLCLVMTLAAADVQLQDVERFPTREQAREAMAFNRAYRETLVASCCLRPHREQWLSDAIQETDQLYRIWDLLDDAWICRNSCGAYSSRALRQLRECLGPGAYCAGTMPPPVPLGRFSYVQR